MAPTAIPTRTIEHESPDSVARASDYVLEKQLRGSVAFLDELGAATNCHDTSSLGTVCESAAEQATMKYFPDPEPPGQEILGGFNV